MIELRNSNRRRVLKGATAAFNNKFSTLDCQVRNISDTGCRLRSDRPHSFPDTFTLIIQLDGLEMDCQVVWRSSADLGVKFTAPIKASQPKRYQNIQAIRPAA